MQLICDDITGDNIGMGETTFPAASGRSIYEVSFEIPQESLTHFTFNGTTLVKKDQAVIDKMVAETSFNVDTFQFGLKAAFSVHDRVALSGLFGELIAYAGFQDYPDLKLYMDECVTQSKITVDQREVIRQVILTQGIDINNY